MKPESRQFQFFTPIELLAVMTVIAILGSMLLPAFNKVRHKARTIDGSSKLRNIGLAQLI